MSTTTTDVIAATATRSEEDSDTVLWVQLPNMGQPDDVRKPTSLDHLFPDPPTDLEVCLVVTAGGLPGECFLLFGDWKDRCEGSFPPTWSGIGFLSRSYRNYANILPYRRHRHPRGSRSWFPSTPLDARMDGWLRPRPRENPGAEEGAHRAGGRQGSLDQLGCVAQLCPTCGKLTILFFSYSFSRTSSFVLSVHFLYLGPLTQTVLPSPLHHTFPLAMLSSSSRAAVERIAADTPVFAPNGVWNCQDWVVTVLEQCVREGLYGLEPESVDRCLREARGV